MGTRKNLNKTDLAKGDQFVVTTKVEFSDVDGDKVTDCTLVHDVDKNGANFVTSTTTWFGLGDAGVVAIKESLAKGGVVDGTKNVSGFKALVKEWRKVTKALSHLNDLGDKHAPD